MQDSKRGNKWIYANDDSAETGSPAIEFTDTGFTVTGSGIKNGTYIYVAIAEPPAARSLTQEEFAEQKLKFLTYQNRKEVECGNMAEQQRDDLIQQMANLGFELNDILKYL